MGDEVIGTSIGCCGEEGVWQCAATGIGRIIAAWAKKRTVGLVPTVLLEEGVESYPLERQNWKMVTPGSQIANLY